VVFRQRFTRNGLKTNARVLKNEAHGEKTSFYLTDNLFSYWHWFYNEDSLQESVLLPQEQTTAAMTWWASKVS